MGCWGLTRKKEVEEESDEHLMGQKFGGCCRGGGVEKLNF